MYITTIDSLKKKVQSYSSGVLLLCVGEKSFDYTEIKKVIDSANVPVVGAFFPGLIAENKLRYTGFLVLHFTSEAEIYFLNAQEDISDAFADSKVQSGTGILLVDSLCSGNQSFLDSVFYELGHRMKFIGGGAGSLDLVQKPCVFDSNGIYENTALVLLLASEVAIGIKHGYDRLAGPFVATDTTANKVAELNWENAFTNYSNIVNQDNDVPITKEDFFSVAKGYPLGISRKGQEDIVRDPISVDNSGVLHCIDDVPENAALYILKGEPTKLIAAAEESCSEALYQVEGLPKHCLLIDCVSRVLYLGDDFGKEINKATDKIHSIYPDMHVKGILSLGEISTFKDGRLELYNKTFLTTMLYDKG